MKVYEKFYLVIGLIFMFYGIFGGCEYFSEYLSIPAINMITKDDIIGLFGITCFGIGIHNL